MGRLPVEVIGFISYSPSLIRMREGVGGREITANPKYKEETKQVAVEPYSGCLTLPV